MHRSLLMERMAQSFICVLLLLAAGSAESSPDASSASRGELRSRLRSVLKQPALAGARLSALVVREADGVVLFEHEPDRMMIPASNAKILTALAVLSTLGPTFQFETQIWSDRAPDIKGTVGRLGVRASGDPALNSEDWWRLASELRAAGLRKVSGDIVLDVSYLDTVRWHPSWQGISSRAYHAPVGALNANYGSFAVRVAPGAILDDPVRVRISPDIPYLRPSLEARTVSPRKRRSLVVDRRERDGYELVTVAGSARRGSEPKTYYRSVSNPAAYAGAILRMQLAANGIEVAGKVLIGKTPAAPHELLLFKGRPLSEIVRLFMKFSNNTIAETLVKDLGARATGEAGSWNNGVPEMRRRLLSLGIASEDFALVDGSGLSYENRASARAMVSALRVASASFGIGPEFLAAFPVAGRDGTLEKRAATATDRVRAKTGLLNQVTALSGFAIVRGLDPAVDAEMPEGERVIFSLLVNGYSSRDGEAMEAVDAFSSALSNFQ